MEESDSQELLESGTLSFTIESRVLRELGERLVKQPEVALIELIKNSYDADARMCWIQTEADGITITDDGHGMTSTEFKNSWMRVGTSSKQSKSKSRKYGRALTGEKGIGRFAVRFLGHKLHLETTAYDESFDCLTKLTADFDWPQFDLSEDLGQVLVPYEVTRAEESQATGTSLQISKLRSNSGQFKWHQVMTSSLSIVTPYASLLRPSGSPNKSENQDKGFTLQVDQIGQGSLEYDLAKELLACFVVRAVVELDGTKLRLRVFKKGASEPALDIVDHYENGLGSVYADIRFFPKRKGTFTEANIDRRRAPGWVNDNSGVAVFDRSFRVQPYGGPDDDWLGLARDTARRSRHPESSIAQKHLRMDEAVHSSTKLNYMLRLPYPAQLVGVVQVEGQRVAGRSGEIDDRLYASADREGFVINKGFLRLRDLIRGAVEAIAFVDREFQQELDRAEQAQVYETLKEETQAAINEIEANPNIAPADKSTIVSRLASTLQIAERREEWIQQRESDLETMSLLGVVAGFMTHEFGGAIHDLTKSEELLTKLAAEDERFLTVKNELHERIGKLNEFVTYSKGFVMGAKLRPDEPYLVRPRINQVIRIFGKYASDRKITVTIDVPADLTSPLIPVSLYNGVALNLYTNALKAITSKVGSGPRAIVFKAWDEKGSQIFDVYDTGIGIPSTLRNRVFDPLFTTTETNDDPLGSGMGLGLSLVKKGIEAYGGKISVVDPPEGFSTAVRVKFSLGADKS